MVAFCDRLIIRGVLSHWAAKPKQKRTKPRAAEISSLISITEANALALQAKKNAPRLSLDEMRSGDAVIVPIFYNRGKGGEKILHCVICRRPQIIKFNSEF